MKRSREANRKAQTKPLRRFSSSAVRRGGALLLVLAILTGCANGAGSPTPAEAPQGPGSFRLYLNGEATTVLGASAR